MVSGPEIFPKRSITYCGESEPSDGWSYPSGYELFSEFIWRNHSDKSGLFLARAALSAGIKAWIVCLTSPITATSAKRFLLISAGSISQ